MGRLRWCLHSSQTSLIDKTEHFKKLVKERDKTKRILICCKDMKKTSMLGVMVSELGEIRGYKAFN